MVISPSGVRQISVPWHEIIAVSFFDVPIRKDRSLGNSIVEDRGNVYVLDLVVVLVRTGAEFNSANEDVHKLSSSLLGLDGGEDIVEVFFVLDVESCVPLSVIVLVVDVSDWFRESHLNNEIMAVRLTTGSGWYTCRTYSTTYTRIMVYRSDV